MYTLYFFLLHFFFFIFIFYDTVPRSISYGPLSSLFPTTSFPAPFPVETCGTLYNLKTPVSPSHFHYN
ncbi:hypothetical protein Scep_021545 [Stephania cephalantha]|uniref:Uncharacterized protein n=1 Tax=Stephania cephalantha TaxID=152367 RepID=A0AAP0I1H7_9MAGN